MTQAAVATLLCAVFLVSVASGYRTLSVGDRILHQSGISYAGYPTNVSSALSSGWVFTPGCDHSRGYRANYQQAGNVSILSLVISKNRFFQLPRSALS